MVTFTVPRQLKPFVWHHQTWAYEALFDCAVATLLSFFKRDKTLLGSAGLTAILHTHARNLDFHPYVHLIVPAGRFNKRQGLWRHRKGLYLFKADNMVMVFRGKFVQAMAQAGYRLPPNTPKKWNADCNHVGKGDKALTYLYRGVISEGNILFCHNSMVTFRYKNSTTKQYQTLTEPVVEFLRRVMQHVLTKGFRRVRDYGFLHGNAKRTLQHIQLMLKVRLLPPPVRKLT
jgi:hypothetical protein